jgi:hypothetical protein
LVTHLSFGFNISDQFIHAAPLNGSVAPPFRILSFLNQIPFTFLNDPVAGGSNEEENLLKLTNLK